MKRTPLALFLLLLISLTSNAQPGQQVRRVPGQLPTMSFPSGKAFVEVPFEVDSNRMVIPITVNGKPLKYVLDTGASGATHTNQAVVKSLGLKISGTGEGRGAGGGGAAFTVQYAENVSFNLGGIAFTNGQLSLRASRPSSYDGVIGRPILASLVTEVDWERRIVRFHDPSKFKYSGSGVSLPLTFDDGGRPYAEAAIVSSDGKEVPVKLVVDTGGAHSLSLDAGSKLEIKAPDGAVKTVLAMGASGEIRGFSGRERTFKLGGHSVNNIPTMYPDSSAGTAGLGGRHGNLGAGVLRRFKIIYDYPGRRMFVEPNKFLADPFGLEVDVASLAILQVSPEKLGEYVGKYGNKEISIRDGGLYYQRIGGRGGALRPIGKDQFALNADARVSFIRDPKGTVDGLVLEPVDREKEQVKRDSNAAVEKPTAQAVDLTPAEQEVRKLEREWLDAYEKYDAEAMARIVSDEFKLTFSNGSSQSKADILTQLRSGRESGRSATKFRTEEVQSRVEGGTVILSGRLIRQSERGVMRMTYTDTYAKRGGRWQVIDSKLARIAN